MIDEYLKARKAGEKEYKARTAAGEFPYLPALDDILPGIGAMNLRHIGMMEIPVEMIAGTRTRARQNSFARNFMPLLEPDTEFAMKWSSLYKAQLEEGFNTPIKVYEYLHRFYVQEGNKRVSVSRFLDMPVIMADVTRVIPDREVLEREPAYAEFLDFYSVCPVYDIECTKAGSYREIAELLGRDLEEPWPDEEVKQLKSGYWTFAKATSSLYDKTLSITPGDAFLVYLRIFVEHAFGARTEKQVGKRVKQIHKELLTASNKDKVSLVESPEEGVRSANILDKTETLIGKIIPVHTYSARNPLKAAFIHERSPEASDWVYSHEEGRRYLESVMGETVKTASFIAGDNFSRAAEEAAAWGADVVFTTSERLMTETLRAAIKYEDIRFLNCSVNLAHQAVRTYYAKLYEAKFLAGVVAGQAAASDGSHKIGYCSDYPIYGTIAGINAFAIGALMADPQVKIYLEWSSRRDNNWWWAMHDKGIRVVSGIDFNHNKDGSNAYGVCYAEPCEQGQGTDLSGRFIVKNLAVPVWKWGRLYEIIIRSILDGTYNTSVLDKNDQATNYWWGMISGVVDIELSDELPVYTRQLVEILKKDIISGTMNPFDGELRSQTGLVRRASDKPLTSMDVIEMEWLNENIIGDIPKGEALTDDARLTVSISGVSGARDSIRGKNSSK